MLRIAFAASAALLSSGQILTSGSLEPAILCCTAVANARAAEAIVPPPGEAVPGAIARAATPEADPLTGGELIGLYLLASLRESGHEAASPIRHSSLGEQP